MLRFRFAGGFFAPRLFMPGFFPILMAAMLVISRIFGTSFPWLLLARRLNSAQGAPEIFDFPFITDFLFFRQFNQFQDLLHLFEGIFERFHDPAHVIHSFGKRRRGILLRLWFVARAFDGRSICGFWRRLRPFNGRGRGAGFFMQMFFRRRRGLSGSGHRSLIGWRDGMGWTQAASSTATATSSATG
jgi:hypothetical protein